MNIYCPGCGAEASTVQKFCRSCGMELKVISQLVTEHFGKVTEASENSRKGIERLGKIISLASGSMLILLFISAIICAAISKVFGLGMEDVRFDFIVPLVVMIALPLLLIGTGMIVYPAIINELSGRRSRQQTLPAAETTGKLFSGKLVESMGSIAEHTTQLLGMSEARDTARKPQEAMEAYPIKPLDGENVSSG
jgi:hypothetical protein